MHFHLPVVADDNKLIITTFDKVKATATHFIQKQFAPDLMLNTANRPANNSTFRRGSCTE